MEYTTTDRTVSAVMALVDFEPISKDIVLSPESLVSPLRSRLRKLHAPIYRATRELYERIT